MNEIRARFGGSPRRDHLLDGLSRLLNVLSAAGCQRVYLDGSFVTDKPIPGDYDLAWETTGVDLSALDPVVMDVDFPRDKQKASFGGDILPNVLEGSTGLLFVDFFQQNKATGGVKGIVAINLGAVAP